MTTLYKDRYVECSDDQLSIRAYFFPWGTKRIPYSSIKAISRFELTPLHGKLRIWGSGTLTYWANLDPGRPKKHIGLIIDTGRRVKTLLTPDEPATVAGLLSERSGVAVGTSDSFPFV
ncbi:MAG: hypothetical protein ACLPQS_01290 [Acidimicrobiales bacterium]